MFKNSFTYHKIRILILGILMVIILSCLTLIIERLVFVRIRAEAYNASVYELYKSDINDALISEDYKKTAVVQQAIEDINASTSSVESKPFDALFSVNSDIKGWLTIEESSIDYVVVQPSADESDYYLNHNFYKEEDKSGTLYIDLAGSLEENSKNIVIHGHNMSSTGGMFHPLVLYKSLDYYKSHPTFVFDTIYGSGDWKIFGVMLTNGSSEREPLFDYRQSKFENDQAFLDFITELKKRSLFITTVDVNLEDDLLMLSTCSYELYDYRFVVMARKVREGEDIEVNIEEAIQNPRPLYPNSWYEFYGNSEAVN